MEGRRRKKRRLPPPPPPPPPPSPPPSPPPPPKEMSGEWENLPDNLLISVLDLLPCPLDLLASSAVCRSWRVVARQSFSASCRPPLLLRPLPSSVHPGGGRRSCPRPLRCDLLSPVDPSAPPRRSTLPAEVTSDKLIGFSHGQLIFATGSCIVFADPFASTVLRTAEYGTTAWGLYYGILTAPISSPDSLLILVSLGSILLWRFSDRTWTDHFVNANVYIDHIVAFKDQFYAINRDNRIFRLNFSPSFSINELFVDWREDRNLHSWYLFRKQLVQCGDELMLVQLCSLRESVRHAKLVVHRLDFSVSPRKWVKVEDLGDWAILIDYAGASPIACSSPGYWGGKKNCVYYAKPGCETWCEFLLNGKATIDTNDPELPFFSPEVNLLVWPSPLWVYPSAFSS